MTKQTDKTLSALLTGKHTSITKYAGKHVFVIKDEIIPLSGGKKGLSDFRKLKEKYRESPVLIFVPQPGASFFISR